MHSVRPALLEFREEHSFLVNLADFVGKFGATTAAIERRLAELDGMRAEADRLCAEQNCEGVLSTDQLAVSLRELGRKAEPLKEGVDAIFLSE